MIISDFGLKPEQTIYYYTGCILKELKGESSISEHALLKSLFGEQPLPSEIYRFNLSLYVLIILNKIEFHYDARGEIEYVYKKIND